MLERERMRMAQRSIAWLRAGNRRRLTGVFCGLAAIAGLGVGSAAAETAPVTDFHASASVSVRVNTSQAEWGSRLLDNINVRELYHCTTTVDVWEPYNLCTANPTDKFHLECEHTVCYLAGMVMSDTYSEDCFFCIDNGCCDEDLGPGGDDPYPDESSYMISMPPSAPVGLELSHLITTAWPLEERSPGNRLYYSTDANRSILFTRPQGVPLAAPCTLTLPVNIPSIVLATGDGDGTTGFARYELVFSSPQLGQIFRSAVRQPKDGMAIIEGAIPQQAFARSMGHVVLAAYQHPAITVAIPAGMNNVRVDVSYVTEGAADWDRNGNGPPDRMDIASGNSLDENDDRVPDEVQPFGLLHNAVGAAVVDPLDTGVLRVVNIGSSGQDGAAVDLDDAAGYGARWALPAWLNEPPAEFVRVLFGVAVGNPGTIAAFGVRSAPGNRTAVNVDLSALGTPTMTVAIMDGDILRALHHGLVAQVAEDLARMDTMLDRWFGSTGPWSDPNPDPQPEPLPEVLVDFAQPGKFVLDLYWNSATQIELVGHGPPVLGNRMIIIAEQQAAPIDSIERVTIVAAGLDYFELTGESAAEFSTVVPGDVNCDGGIDFFDIDGFLLALFDEAGYAAAYPDCDRNSADVNEDGAVDFFDIDRFLEVLFRL